MIAITHAFDAPPGRLWQEWTEPERFADWFGGAAAEVPVSTVSMDVRVGGLWRATMFAGAGGSDSGRSAGAASTARWSSPAGSSSRCPTTSTATPTSW